MVVGRHGVQAHKPAHGAAGDEGVLPVRQGGEHGVDIGLEGVHQPFHGGAPPTPDVAHLRVVKGKGGVFREAAVVGVVVALHRRDDDRQLGGRREVRHAPALAVGGVLIEKDVVAVEHIEDRIAGLGVFLEGVRYVDVGTPGLVSGELRDGDAPFCDHCQVPFLLNVKEFITAK